MTDCRMLSDHVLLMVEVVGVHFFIKVGKAYERALANVRNMTGPRQ